MSAFSGYTDEWIDKVQDLSRQQVQILIQEQYDTMMETSGLAHLLTCINLTIQASGDPHEPLSLVASTSSASIQKSMHQLRDFLVDFSMDVSESLYLVQSVDISRMVAFKGRKKFLDTYRDDIVARIMDPYNKVYLFL